MIIASVVLPSPGGPDSSTWSGAAPRAVGGLQDQPELLADPRLADELSQVLGTQRRLDGAVVDLQRRVDEVIGVGHRREPQRRGRLRSSPQPRERPIELQRRPKQDGDIGLGGGLAELLGHGDQRCVGVPHAPAEPDQGGMDLGLPATGGSAGGGAGPAASAPMPGQPSLSLSSRTMRWAPFGRCRAPGSARRGPRSPRSGAARPGVSAASIAWASRGPTPLTVCTSSKTCALVVVGEAVQRQRVLADDQRRVNGRRLAHAQAGERCRRALDRQADAADLDHR